MGSTNQPAAETAPGTHRSPTRSGGSWPARRASLAVLNLAYATAGSHRWQVPQALWWVLTAAAALGIGAFAGHLSAVGVLGLLTAASVAPVAVDLWQRIHVRQHRRSATASRSSD